MESLFSEYIKLKNELDNKGGPKAVLESPGTELEKIYERSLSIEDEILARFGLPKSIRYRKIIWEMKSESDSIKIINELNRVATEVLLSSPRTNVELLEEAKIKNLKSFDILPEIGFDDTLHTIFYFEEYFKKGIITAQELIDILRSINKETSVQIGQFKYYTNLKPELDKAELLYNQLSEKKIPYLEELKNWRLEYPY